MFFIHPNGSSGELPDGSALPAGAEQVNRGRYLKHLRDQEAAVGSQVAQQVFVEQQQAEQRKAARQVLQDSAQTKLLDLGLSLEEAQLLTGGAS